MLTEIENSIKVLKGGGIIIYPTDTVWGIGCDATNNEAVSKVFKIKERSSSKSMIVLVSDVAMLEQYVKQIPDVILQALHHFKNPTSIIYKNPKNLSRLLLADDGSVGIRIVNDKFCKLLIHSLKKPLVSTSANISGEPTPLKFDEIDPKIFERADYIVNLHHYKKAQKPSSILRLNSEGVLEVLRS